MFMPDEFVPELEGNSMMVPITEWVINEALRTLRGWRDAGYDLTMAVNIGARCLAEDAQFFEIVDRLVAAWGIPAGKLTFELTESALIDTAQPGLLGRLESLDERISIDDFGTGYSSLVYLQQLPVARAQGRPVVRDDDADRGREGRDGAVDHRPGAQPQRQGGGRGRRGSPRRWSC